MGFSGHKGWGERWFCYFGTEEVEEEEEEEEEEEPETEPQAYTVLDWDFWL